MNNLLALPNQQLVWLRWGSAYVIGFLGGFFVQKRWLVAREGLRVTLRGEWLTMGVMMIYFWSSFVLGMLSSVSPEVVSTTGFIAGFAALEGLCAGTFLGRPIRILAS